MPRVKGQAEIEKKNQALGRLQIQYVPITSIYPNNYNPNRQSADEFELLQRSMKEDGFTQPIVCVLDDARPNETPDMPDGFQYPEGVDPRGKVIRIVDGEHRWRAAKTIGWTQAPVVVTPMNLEQARIATLRHNRARGSEDVELAAQVLRDLRELGALDWAADSLMLDEVELDRLLNDVSAPEALADEEYQQAWAPVARSGNGSVTVNEPGQTTEHTSTVLRQVEARINSAATAEERKRAQDEAHIYRVAAIYTGEESDVVKAVTGDQPAVRILSLCHLVATGEVAFDEHNAAHVVH